MNQILKKIYSKNYRKVFLDYPGELKKAIGDCKTLLDVGCGSNSPINSFSKKFYSVGIDSFSPSIDKSKNLGIHNKYSKMNVLDIEKNFKPNSFDCVLASDLIEHLTKKEGIKLIEMMERIAIKKIIIFTPNGFLHQGEYDNNPFQIHKSGWTTKEMKERGYKVIGINGLKNLRGEYATIKFKPKLFWRVVSEITQIFTRNVPEKAFQILCIKTKKFDK